LNSYNRKILTISFLSIPLSAGIALVPVLSNIAAAFPNQEGSIQLLITVPSLFMMFSSLLTDKLSEKTSLKTTTIISIIIILFSGISPYWINNFAYLLCTRAFMGIGLGLLNTAIASLPALYFSDDKSRDSAVGIQSAFVCAGGILFNILSGTFAKYNWKFVFLVQLLNIVPLIVAMILMPKTENKKVKTDISNKKNIFVKSAIPVAAISFICIILTCTYPLNLSLFVERSGLGNSQFVGLLASINSAIGFFIGLVFGKVYSKTKGKTLTLGLILTAAALLIVRSSPNQAILLIGSVFFGIGTSFISPTLYSMLYKRVKQEEIVLSVALLGIASNVSQFISPFIINPIAKAVDGNNIEGTRLFVASILIIVLLLILKLTEKRKIENRKSLIHLKDNELRNR